MSLEPKTDLAIQTLENLAITEFRARSMRDEGAGLYPIENLKAIYDLGLWHSTVSKEYGGLDGSLLGKNPGLFLELLRIIAKGDAATAHCFQLHNHGMWSLESVATPEQKERFLKPLASRFSICAGVGSEPGRVNMYEMKTKARKVDGGWVINGVKNFATNGGHADFVTIAAALDGNEGAGTNLTLIIEPNTPGVTWIDDWYRPNGMKLARSPLVKLEEVFVPDINLLGDPGRYKNERWQGRYHLGFAANYLGGAEGVYEWYLDYAKTRGRTGNPLVQLRTGEMKIKLDAARALFRHAIRAWQKDDVVEAELISMAAKTTAAQVAFDISRQVVYTAGATAQFEEHPLGYFLRNIETHVVHAGHDRTAQIIGQAQLGEVFDSTLQR